MVRIGIIGIGFMGMIHYYGAKKVNGCQVTAICTRNPKKLDGDWTSIQGNFGPRGGIEDLSNVATYNRIADLLADSNVDLVDICLPTEYHKEVTIAALKAGKHVLCEKPIEVDIDAANEMVEVSQQSGKQFMVAHVLPFFPEFNYALKTVQSGKYGDLLGAHFRRLTSQPSARSAETIIKSGAPGIDLHIHDTHFIQVLGGMPDAVFSRGKIATSQDGIATSFVDYLSTQYIYQDNPQLTISSWSGGISAKARAFSHGFEIFLERATLTFEASTLAGQGVSNPLQLIESSGEVHHPDLDQSDPVDAFTNEIAYAVSALEGSVDDGFLSSIGARDALALCYKEAESVATGRIVAV